MRDTNAMTLTLLALILVLALLYFISRSLSKSLFTFFLIVFRSRPVAVSILLVLTFPGTVIHELAHLFTAEILRVRTGKLSLVPESIREANITSGSVAIAETDPFRRYAIGLAPIFWGLTVLTAIAYFLPGLIESVFSSGLPVLGNADFYWLLIACYCLFAVSNTMFSSPQDLHGFIPFSIVLLGFMVAGYLLGLRINLSGAVLDLTVSTLQTLLKSLGVVLGINIALLTLSSLLNTAILRTFRLRIH